MVCFDENGIVIPSTATSPAYSQSDEQCLVDFYTQFNLCSLTVTILSSDIHSVFITFSFESQDRRVLYNVREKRDYQFEKKKKKTRKKRKFPRNIQKCIKLQKCCLIYNFWDKWVINSNGVHGIRHWSKLAIDNYSQWRHIQYPVNGSFCNLSTWLCKCRLLSRLKRPNKIIILIAVQLFSSIQFHVFTRSHSFKTDSSAISNDSLCSYRVEAHTH